MSKTLRAGLALATCMLAATPAFATTTTFAQYFQTNGAEQDWTITTTTSNNTTTTTISSTSQVYLSLSGVGGLPFSGPELATLTFNASSTQLGNCGISCGTGDNLNQQGYSGSFEFTDEGADHGADLLSGTFATNANPSTSGAQFSSHVGSGSASFTSSSTSADLQQLALASAFIDFTNATNETASFSLSSLIPNFATGTVSPSDHAYPANGIVNASASGTFSANLNAVPEPASIALIGTAILSLGLIRRRRA